MRRCIRPLLSVLILVLWLVSGPVAMAFDGCAMMGAMCEAPCGVLSYIVAPTTTDMASLQPLAYLVCRLLLEKKKNQNPLLIVDEAILAAPCFLHTVSLNSVYA